MGYAATKRTEAEAITMRLDQLIRDLEAEERKERRLEALRDERRALDVKLALAARLGPDGRHTVTVGFGGGRFQIDRDGAELRSTAMRRIGEVDREIERVSRDGVPDPSAAG